MDKSDLEMHVFHIDVDEDEILEALLTCPHCNRYYPVIYGIPIMTPDEYREKSLEAPILERWGLEPETGEAMRLALESRNEGKNRENE